jgi:hypothetical protein
MRGVRVHRPALGCTRIHGFQAAAIFYPDFYPKRQSGGIETSFLLVTAARDGGIGARTPGMRRGAGRAGGTTGPAAAWTGTRPIPSPPTSRVPPAKP